MDTTGAADLVCLACGTVADATPGAGRCDECGGPLCCRYDFEESTVSRDALERERYDGVARYAPLLPFDAETLVTMAEGTTPLVPAPELADELGVESALVKDEGRNPTGTVRDRALSLAVTAAREAGAGGVALPTTGDGGQSAAAYAARAGLDSEAFVPTRSTFVAKAMTNVHGGEMSVVEGRYPDAVAAFEEAMAEGGAGGDGESGAVTRSVAPGETPYRHEGLKTLTYELVEALDWTAPDAVVYPTAHGESVVGGLRALEDLSDCGLAGGLPALHVAQPDGCSPIVDAWTAGTNRTEPVEQPDTLVGALEVPEPALGAAALDAVRETGGRAVAADDDAALEGAVALAADGIEASATGGVGVAAARELAGDGAFDADDTVVVVNPVAGNKENDVLRSHLMRKGV